MFCTTIIPTVGRPTLERAVNSVLDQDFTEAPFEVIVVNDSGQILAPASWQDSDRVRVVNTQRRERSVARNTGAALAHGEYLHFLDDDDWLAPNALRNLWHLAQECQDADWLYGSTQLVNRDGSPLIELHPALEGNSFIQAVAGEWVPLQASLIRASRFFDIGGFSPTIAGPEDIDLQRRILLRGDIAGIHKIVTYLSWGETGSTTDYRNHQARGLWARERILDSRGAFARMRKSALAPKWHGRIVRAYLTSALWNVKRQRIFDALGRGVLGWLAAILSGPALLSPVFWRAVLKSYDSEAFERGDAAVKISGQTQTQVSVVDG